MCKPGRLHLPPARRAVWLRGYFPAQGRGPHAGECGRVPAAVPGCSCEARGRETRLFRDISHSDTRSFCRSALYAEQGPKRGVHWLQHTSPVGAGRQRPRAGDTSGRSRGPGLAISALSLLLSERTLLRKQDASIDSMLRRRPRGRCRPSKPCGKPCSTSRTRALRSKSGTKKRCRRRRGRRIKRKWTRIRQ